MSKLPTVDHKDESGNESEKSLRQQGAHFVHNISTPIATLQLNVEVLAKYLPTLVNHYRKSINDSAVPSPIPEETLIALQRLADPMQQSITTVQQRTQAFSHELQQYYQPNGATAQVAAPGGDRPSDADMARSIARMLIIEDEEIHQQVAVKQLLNLCEVDVASNGMEAMEMWLRDHYDLLLMDFVLPGMSAPQILQAIAEGGGRPPVVIGFTNLPEIPGEYADMAIPITAYLSKPFTLMSFEVLLKRLNLRLGGETQT